MVLKEFGLVLLAVLASALGQFFLKAGALKLGKVTTSNFWGLILNIVVTPELITGLLCYGLGAIAYILLLTRVNLSIAAPSVALIYVFAVLIGYFIFKEPIPINRVIGLGLIVCGVVLVVWKN